MGRQVQLHLIIHGRVQGVFFRLYAKEAADRLRLTGFARNTEDGSLELVAEGFPERLDEFERGMRKGPHLAHIESVFAQRKEASGRFTRFALR